MAETSNFYFLYDIRQESIPAEEEWARRCEKFVKHIPDEFSEDKNEIIKVSAEEDEIVKNMENVRQGQFDENLAGKTLIGEGISINTKSGISIKREL